MAVSFDRELLERLGLDELSEADGVQLLGVMQDLFQIRVVEALVDHLTTTQLDAFEVPFDAGEDAALQWLSDEVPAYPEVVSSKFDLLCAEVAAAASRILDSLVSETGQGGLTGMREDSGQRIAWIPVEGHIRPGPGPVLVGAEGDWCVIVSPMAGTIVSIHPQRDEIYGRRGENPSVVLRLPDGHHVDPTMVWCGEDGEIRVRFSKSLDLRWQLPDRPASTIRDYDKVRHRRRDPLRWTNVRKRNSDFVTITAGPWVVKERGGFSVLNRTTGREFALEGLHFGLHSTAVSPHFTPDGSQLVVLHEVDFSYSDVSHNAGVSACATDYLTAIGATVVESPDDDAEPRWPWEHWVRLNLTDDPRQANYNNAHLGSCDIGYDQSSMRSAVVDRRVAHLFDTSDWAELGSARRPDQTARAEAVRIPGDEAPTPCWAGRAVIAAASDGTVWRLDLQHGNELEPLVAAHRGQKPVVALTTGENAILVHADRELIVVGADGGLLTTDLGEGPPVRCAGLLPDGRLLIGSSRKLEMWNGSQLISSVEVTGSPVVGLATCDGSNGWALLWHADESVSSVRIGARSIHVIPDSVPHRPGFGFSLSAVDGIMVDVDSWFLVQRTNETSGAVQRVLASPWSWTKLDQPGADPLEWYDKDAPPIISLRPTEAPLGLATVAWQDWQVNSIAHMKPAGLVAVGTEQGIGFIAAPHHGGPPDTVQLDAPVLAIATGSCPRSLAAATAGHLWLIRLLG